MKHLTTILAAVLCAVCLSGCDAEETPAQRQQRIDNACSNKFSIINYNGHSYLHYGVYGYSGITHDPDCPCHKKGGEE